MMIHNLTQLPFLFIFFLFCIHMNAQDYMTKKQHNLIKEISNQKIAYEQKGEAITTFLKTIDTTSIVEIFGQHGMLLNSMFVTEFLERLRFLEYGTYKEFRVHMPKRKTIYVQHRPIREEMGYLSANRRKKIKPVLVTTSLVGIGYGVERLAKYLPIESDFNNKTISDDEFEAKHNLSRGGNTENDIDRNLAIGTTSLLVGVSLLSINSGIKVSINRRTTQSLSLNLEPSSINFTYSF